MFRNSEEFEVGIFPARGLVLIIIAHTLHAGPTGHAPITFESVMLSRGAVAKGRGSTDALAVICFVLSRAVCFRNDAICGHISGINFFRWPMVSVMPFYGPFSFQIEIRCLQPLCTFSFSDLGL
jgi:hypothetical protein